MGQHIITIDEIPRHTFGSEDCSKESRTSRKFLIELLKEKADENY